MKTNAFQMARHTGSFGELPVFTARSSPRSSEAQRTGRFTRTARRSGKTNDGRQSGATFSRSGVTLTEVLMSLMIMSIGVSAVAVLFPISVLRSVQATQLTNAAILRENARTLVEMKPELVFDPDGDGNYQEHLGARKELKYIVDPTGYYAMTSNGMTYATFPSLSAGNNATIANQDAQRGAADWFGNLDANGDGVPESLAVLPRFDAGIRYGSINNPNFPVGFRPAGGDPEELRALRALAANVSKLGDAWDTQVESIPIEYLFANGSSGMTAAPGAAITGVRFPVDVDLSAVPTGRSLIPVVGSTAIIPDPETCRVVVFSVDGNFSASLPLTQIVGSDVIWSEDVNQNGALDALEDLNKNGTLDIRRLPDQFLVFNASTGSYEYQIGRVVLQSSRTQDYNWLLTVRRGRDGQTRGIDVVVTHNKGLTPADERAYSAQFTAGSSLLSVHAAGGLVEPGGELAQPGLRKGGYVLDVSNARWYRIQAHRQSPTVKVGTTTAPGYLINLETSAIESAVGAAVFIPGVVDVYPAGSLTIPMNL
ncbi:MAG: prepilin-type N-terminal cleavage/methylation domain-containing protein [Planctomycetota bacterium]